MELLLGMQLNKKNKLLFGWRPGYFEKFTLLIDAVILRRVDIVAILLSHGADPEQIFLQRDSICAFDNALILKISYDEAIPSASNNFFNIICTHAARS